jgi:hypothetical protein
VDKDEVAEQVAQQAFNCMGFMPTPERLAHSVLATAWAIGFPQRFHAAATDSPNPWSAVTLHYHYQEALVIRFWAMQAELKFGYLTKIMRMTEEEFAVPVRATGVSPLEVLRAMTHWSLTRAMQRARVVGSPGDISAEAAVKTYNSLVLRYEALVTASAQVSRPTPIEEFQLGLSAKHPDAMLLWFCAENLSNSLDLDEDVQPLAAKVMQLSVSQIQNGLYRALQALP